MKANTCISVYICGYLSIIVYIYIYIYIYRAIGLMSRVFANGLEDRGSIPGDHTKDSKNGT